MSNFSKPLNELTEKEILDGLNHWPPSYGALGSYELLRRLAVKNEGSSKRFARWSIILTIAALILSLVQIWLAWPKTTWCSVSTSDPVQHCKTDYH